MISEREAMELWRRANRHKVGIAVKTEHRWNLMQRLYQMRARHPEEDFQHLMLAYGPDHSEVWVIHRPGHPAAIGPVRPMTEGDLNDL